MKTSLVFQKMQVIHTTSIVLFALSILGCSRPAPHPKVEIREYRKVENFVLTDQGGQPVTADSFKGKIWVANFIFTSCAVECITLSQQMKALQKRYQTNPNIKLASFSVDPQTDTPKRLASYAEGWAADPKKWHFLTGKPQDLDRIARDSFLVTVDKTQTPFSQTAVIHSNKLAIIDENLVVRAYVDGLAANATDQVADVISRLSNSGSL